MGYRIIADENVEPYTRRYLDQLGHDVEWVGDVPELGLSVSDEEIATYSRRTDRLVLTQDDDFFTRLDVTETSGVLFQRDQHLSGTLLWRRLLVSQSAVSRIILSASFPGFR